jgi:4-hydroxy-3-methylbut-2-en-1-yl diphosphate synthase IspG/GcpE
MSLNNLMNLYSNINIRNMTYTELMLSIDSIEAKIQKIYNDNQNLKTINVETLNEINALQKIHEKLNKQVIKILDKNTNS